MTDPLLASRLAKAPINEFLIDRRDINAFIVHVLGVNPAEVRHIGIDIDNRTTTVVFRVERKKNPTRRYWKKDP